MTTPSPIARELYDALAIAETMAIGFAEHHRNALGDIAPSCAEGLKIISNAMMAYEQYLEKQREVYERKTKEPEQNQ